MPDWRFPNKKKTTVKTGDDVAAAKKVTMPKTRSVQW